jgi:hypothetical protein
MKDILDVENQILLVSNFQDLISTPFQGQVNAISWKRTLVGDFSEIVEKLELDGNITEIDQEDLLELQLTEQGQLARKILLNDFKLLTDYGASPCLNIIKYYERDDENPFFPTDVYSFHVDRSPIATDTFLCTYLGESSEIIRNSQAIQKTLVPEIREELKKLYLGDEEGFESFLTENFYDLHYQALPTSKPISLGVGHLWRLACDHPDSEVLPCLHRAPDEKDGQNRLLMIC